MQQAMVLVTRPQPQADVWAQALQQQLGDAAQVRALPLIEVDAVPAAAYQQRLQQVWGNLPQWQAAYFVSIPAVRYFFAVVPDALARWQAATLRAWAPGRGTRQALLEQGVPADRIDSPPSEAGQFDSETLWPLIAQHLAPDRAVLRVRGTDHVLENGEVPDAGAGRDWMARQLDAIGIPVDTVVAYQRRAPQWSEQQCKQVRAWNGPNALWVCSSSQALDHLQQLLPGHDWQQATALATHPRIAERAAHCGFGRVLQTRPSLADVLQSIQSWL